MNKPSLQPLALFAFTWLPVSSALACANDYSPNFDISAASQSLVWDLRHVVLREPWTARRDRLHKAVESGGDYKIKNDYAVALMHTGDPKAAIPLLEEIEKTKPGLYQTASNLGTAFELAGEDRKALEWIRKGIEINPKSHDSSEWLHVKILEAKIALTQGQNWENEGSILGLSFARGSTLGPPTRLPSGNSGKSLSLDQVESSLKYQLRERLQFVKPPDPIVASLLLDLGNLIALSSGRFGLAQGVYELATSYAKSDGGHYRHVRKQIDTRHRAALKYNRLRSMTVGPVKFWALVAVFAATAVYLLLKVRDLVRC